MPLGSVIRKTSPKHPSQCPFRAFPGGGGPS